MLRFDKDWSEFSDSLRLSIEENLSNKNYATSKINISVTVTIDHGSIKAAVINGVNLALMDAGIEMKDMLIGCTAGIAQSGNEPFVDMNYNEETRCRAHLTLAY